MATPGIGIGVSSERPQIPEDESTKIEQPEAPTEEIKLPETTPPQSQEAPEMVIEAPQGEKQPVKTDNQSPVVSNLRVQDLDAPIINPDQAQKLQQEILDAANQ